MKKKLVTILMAVVFCVMLTACGKSTVKNLEKSSPVVSGSAASISLTMDKASKANGIVHLLEKYKTVTYAQMDYVGGSTVHITYFKNKNEVCSTEDDFNFTGYRTDAMVFYREKGKSDCYITATKEANVSGHIFVIEGGKFTSQTIDANGNYVCETQADISQDYADQLSKVWPATTKDKMVTSTVFAADDLRALSVDFFIRHPNGSKLRIASGVLLYNQKISHTDSVKEYLKSSKYAVKVKMEDGKVRTAQVPKGMSFTWECDKGYALYKDKGGKNPVKKKADAVKSDLTLYCLPKK